MSDALSEQDKLPPKVFISYSHDDENHKNWVKELATKLRVDGINAIFDQLTPFGTDLPLFMEQGLSDTHKVLCICSSTYNEKANAGKSGVNYEKRIIFQELLQGIPSAWVIPIIRNNKTDVKLPKFLSGFKYISFDDDKQFNKNYYDLLEELHNKKNIPPIGKNPFEHDSGIIGKINEMNQITKTLSSAVNHEGRVRFNYLANSGIFTFGSNEYEFKTYWAEAGNKSIHGLRDYLYAIALTSEEICLDELSIQKYDFSSRARTPSIGDSLIWINRFGRILITKIENIEFEDNLRHWVELSYMIMSVLEPIDLSGISMNGQIEAGE